MSFETFEYPQQSYITCPTQVDATQLSEGAATRGNMLIDDNAPWGSLLSLSSDIGERYLHPVPEGLLANKINLHVLGRAHKKCNILFDVNIKRISNTHCRIYCTKEGPEQRVQAWIEDLSNNGTYMNRGKERLKKNIPRILKDGEEVSLINPLVDVNNDAEVHSKELKRASFVFRMLHPRAFNANDRNLDGNTNAANAGIFWNLENLENSGEKQINRNNDSNNNSSSSSSSSSSGDSKYTNIDDTNNTMNGPVRKKLRIEDSRKRGSGAVSRQSTLHDLIVQDRSIHDHYEISGKIGEGSAAQVHRAVNKITSMEYAIKVTSLRNFRVGHSTDSNGRYMLPTALLKEAEIVRGLKHPRIIGLHDVFITSDKLFLVMELMTGGDLLDRILDTRDAYMTKLAAIPQDQRFTMAPMPDVRGYSESNSKIVMQQLLDAIAYLHERKIAHRDLKPENILLMSRSSDVDIKVTDFGLAKIIDSKGTKTFCGTNQYMAPEVLRVKLLLDKPKSRANSKGDDAEDDDEQRYSLEADIWSVGVILYVLLSGCFPFDDGSGNTDVRAVLNAQYDMDGPLWDSISDHAKDLISQMLQLDATLRITAAKAMEHPWLQRISNEEDTHGDNDKEGEDR